MGLETQHENSGSQVSAPADRPKICLVLDSPVGSMGGTQVLVRELARGLSTFFRVVLVSKDTTESLPQDVAAAIECHINVPLPHSRASGEELCRRLKEHHVELVHFHLGGTYMWRTRSLLHSPIHCIRRAKIPYILTNHGVFGFFGYCGPQQPLLFKLGLLPFAWFSRFLLAAKSCAEVAVSNSDLAKLRNWFLPCSHKFECIHHSILHHPEENDTSKECLSGVANRKKTVLSVGHVAFRKGQAVLAEAFVNVAANHSDWNLVIAGSDSGDSCWQRIESIIVKNSLSQRITLLGARSDVQELMRNAEIFVQPSLNEPFGLALQEALNLGCACIATRSGGTGDLISNDDNGILVEPGDPAAIAEAIDRLIRNADTREHFSHRGPTSIREKNMCANGMVEKYRAIYSRVLQKSS